MANIDERSMDLLNELYKNAEMGINAISTLHEKADDDSLKKELSAQLHNYRAMEAQIEREIQSRGHSASSASAIGCLGLRASVKINLLMNKSPTHIAQMMMEGANMGVIDLTRSLHQNAQVDPKVKDLADKLMQTEQQSIEVMRKFL